MAFFKCKHPAHKLAVFKDSTIRPKDEDFKIVTHHLFCQRCNERVDIEYAKLIGGAKQFLRRVKDDNKLPK